MSSDERCALAQALIVIALIIGGLFYPVFAQEHHGHPPQDQTIHEKFYSNWMMPDSPHISCCHNEDCFPAQSKFVDGSWYARKTNDDDWILIPPNKIEQNRDSPDGRSHLCGRHASSGDFMVFCFARGGGV
jgi:hypothetical protein